MNSVQAVSDIAFTPEALEQRAEALGRSKIRQQVFRAIYTGKVDPKSVSYLMKVTGLSQKAVLTAGRQLDQAHLATQTEVGKGGRKEVAYKKIAGCYRHRDKILKYASNPVERKKIPTLRRLNGAAIKVERITVPRNSFSIQLITIDDIDSFKKVKSIKSAQVALSGMSETRFKNGVKAIIGELATFKDWGGEKSDLMTTRMRLNGKRIATAFAFKGPGQPGKLTPAKMGKNGDQCQRLFQEQAEVFVVQHWREIDSSVHELVATFATVKSIASGRRIYYCLIDGQDSQRLVKAYPKHFPKIK